MLSFVEISPLVPERKIFEVFLTYMHMAAILVMCPRLFVYTLISPSYRCFTKMTLISQAVSEEKMFVNIMVMYIYNAPRWGQMSAWGPFFFQNN